MYLGSLLSKMVNICLKKVKNVQNKRFQFVRNYKGFSLAAISVVPNFAITMTGYELISRINSNKNSYLANFLKNFGASSLVSLIASVVTYPIDTLKRLVQISGSKGFTNEFFSISHAFEKVKSHGISNFYKYFVV